MTSDPLTNEPIVPQDFGNEPAIPHPPDVVLPVPEGADGESPAVGRGCSRRKMMPETPYNFDKATGEKIVTVNIVIAILGTAALIVCLIPCIASWGDRIPARISLFYIATVPPFWMWYEYYFIWKAKDSHDRPDFDEHKYGHELSRNVWLGLAAAIAAIYFSSS